MGAFTKKILIIVVCLTLLSTYSFRALASAELSVSITETLQVKTNDNFVVPITISARGANFFVKEISAFLESPDIFVESPTLNRMVHAGSTTRINLLGNIKAAGLYRVRIEISAENRSITPATPITIIREVLIEATKPADKIRPHLEVTGVSSEPASPDITKPFTLNLNLTNIGNQIARDVVAAFDGGANFAVTALTDRVRIPSVGTGQQVLISFQIRARDTHKSNEVRLTLTYGEHTQTIPLNLPLPDMPEQPKPHLEVTGVSFEPESVDITKPFTLNLNLTNIGNQIARDVVATFDGGANFAVTALTDRVRIPSVDAGQQVDISFQIRSRDTHKSNEVTLTLTYGAHTQTKRLNLPLPERRDLPKRLPPLLKVESFSIVPAEENNLSLTLNVQNIGELSASSVRVSIDGGDKLIPLKEGGIRRISSIAGGKSASFQYLLSPKGELVNHPLNIEFNFEDPDGKALKESERLFVSSNLEPLLKITGFSARPQGGDGEFLLRFSLKNAGYSSAKNISARFTGTQTFPLAVSNLLIVPDIAAGMSLDLSLPMKAAQKSEMYTIPIEINFRSIGGYNHKVQETISLSAESIGVDPKEDEKKSTPRVMLERHTLSVEQIFAGSNFTLALYIRNNSNRSVGNMKISLGSIQVADVAGGGGGGTVFSPLDGSSSSFFVEKIDARAQLVKEVTLFVDPNAAAKTYTLPISIAFEDDDGNPFSVNESVNVPVLQETRIQVLSVDVPTNASAGQGVSVSMEFANTGRVPLNNVLVEIKGDFPKENATYFIPRLEIGMSDFFQGMIIPDTEGTLTGKILLTYLDALDQEVTIEHPFEIEVMPMIDIPVDISPGGPPDTGVVQGGLSLLSIIGIGVVGLLLLAAAFFIIRKIRRKRKDDFFAENA